MDIQPDLTLCIAYSGKPENLKGLLNSIRTAADPVSCETIVVHGSNDQRPPDALLSAFPEVLFYEEPDVPPIQKLNRALELASARYLSLWADSVSLEAETLSRLLSFLDDHPEVGLAAPLVRDSAGNALDNARPLPGFFSALAGHASYGGLLPLIGEACRTSGSQEPMQAAWLSRRALVFRREVLDDLGPMDSGFFLLYADADYCRRAAALGWRLYLLPSATCQDAAPEWLHPESPGLDQPPRYRGDLARFLCRKWLASR